MQSDEQDAENQIVVVGVRHDADRAREGEGSRDGRFSLVAPRRQQQQRKDPGRQEVQVPVEPCQKKRRTAESDRGEDRREGLRVIECAAA